MKIRNRFIDTGAPLALCLMLGAGVAPRDAAAERGSWDGAGRGESDREGELQGEPVRDVGTRGDTAWDGAIRGASDRDQEIRGEVDRDDDVRGVAGRDGAVRGAADRDGSVRGEANRDEDVRGAAKRDGDVRGEVDQGEPVRGDGDRNLPDWSGLGRKPEAKGSPPSAGQSNRRAVTNPKPGSSRSGLDADDNKE